MSVHSLNHLDTSYKGYEIDANGGVTEIYDHRFVYLYNANKSN